MPPKVSVIVTIFNREKYIKECAQSLFEQTLDNIEYVFVDDASTDRSIEELTLLMYKFPKRIPQVKIIRLKYNGGVANARNVGIQNATGEYVIHTDSDDWIDKEMFEVLYQKAIDTGADIIGCNITHEYPSTTTVLKQHYGSTVEENIKNLLRGDIHPSLCTSLTRMSLIKEKNVQFLTGLNMGEDLFFNLQLYVNSNNILGIDFAPYHYRHTQDSSSFHHNRVTIDSGIAIGKHIEAYMKKIGKYRQFAEDIEYRKFSLKMSLVYNFDNVDNYHYWLETFPETHKSIWKYKQLDWKLRLQLWLAAHRMFFAARSLKSIIEYSHACKLFVKINSR